MICHLSCSGYSLLHDKDSTFFRQWNVTRRREAGYSVASTLLCWMPSLTVGLLHTSPSRRMFRSAVVQ
jgi:hypothetical protein